MNCFAQVNIIIDDDPNNHDGRRPDLSVLNSKNCNNKELLMDISITQSILSCTTVVPSSFSKKSHQATSLWKKDHQQATHQEAYTLKINKYQQISEKNNYLFRTMIFEGN